MEEPTTLDDLDHPARLARCQPRIAALAATLGDCSHRIDDRGNLRIEGSVAGSERRFYVLGRLKADPDRLEVLGEVLLRVELDNHLGYFNVVHEEDEPDLERMTRISGELFAHDIEADERKLMIEVIARVDGLADAAESFLKTHDHYGLELGADMLEVSLADLDDEDEDWADCVANVAAELTGLDAIGRSIEALPLVDFVTCAYCAGRFLTTTASRCTHCGAAI